jgi:hypothetical protein
MRSASVKVTAVTAGIPVAIAADPRSQAEKRCDLCFGTEQIFERRVKARDLGQKRRIVIRKAVLDFVAYREPHAPQHAGLPQRQHGASQLLIVRQTLLGIGIGAIALRQQPSDFGLPIQDAASLHFGGVCGEDGRYLSAREKRREVGP